MNQTMMLKDFIREDKSKKATPVFSCSARNDCGNTGSIGSVSVSLECQKEILAERIANRGGFTDDCGKWIDFERLEVKDEHFSYLVLIDTVSQKKFRAELCFDLGFFNCKTASIKIRFKIYKIGSYKIVTNF